MPDLAIQVIQSVSTVLGAGVIVAMVNGWNHRAIMRAKDAVQDRKDAVGILREALDGERKEHSDCTARLQVVEAAAFRDREERIREQAICATETAHLRSLVLETYVKTTPPDARDPSLVRKLSEPSRSLPPPTTKVTVVEVDTTGRAG